MTCMKKDGAVCSGARGLGLKKGSECSVRENGSQQVFLTPSGSCSSPVVGIRGNPKLISQNFQRLVSGHCGSYSRAEVRPIQSKVSP